MHEEAKCYRKPKTSESLAVPNDECAAFPEFHRYLGSPDAEIPCRIGPIRICLSARLLWLEGQQRLARIEIGRNRNMVVHDQPLAIDLLNPAGGAKPHVH